MKNDDDAPADREAWFKAVELAVMESSNLGRTPAPENEARRARDLYVLLSSGRTVYEV
jgi:hypothetical protein